MKKLVLSLVLLALSPSVYQLVMAQEIQTMKPPIAKKVPKTTSIHGDALVDDYFWLREKTNPEVLAYLKAEDEYADAAMHGTESLQTALYNEMLARIKETDVNVPYRQGKYFYYSRTEKGKQYPILCRKQGSVDAREEIVLELNQMAEGQKYLGLGSTAVSDDGNLFAYGLDTTGFRQYVMHIRDLHTGRDLQDSAERVTSLCWGKDNKTVYYTVEDPVSKRSYRFYRHVLGSTSPDVPLYEEKDELFNVSVDRSLSKGFVFLTADSYRSSEVYYLDAGDPAAAPKSILPRQLDHRYYVDHHGDLFYIRTNLGAKNFRLVAAPISDPRQQNWKEVIPHRNDVMLSGVTFFKDFYVALERQDGLPLISVTDFKTGTTRKIDFPEPVYSAFPMSNEEFDTTTLRFSYQSLTTPLSVYDYDMHTRKRQLMKQTEVLGGYKPTDYQAERLYATASDGTRVPISLVYKKDLKKDGTRPMLLEGYGSYGISSNVGFSSARLSLLDRGFVYAVAHIRGGGEMGETWHDQGKMMMKRNTFTDFISAAEFLEKEKYTSKDRIVITGGSAGGLLMGAVLNMRPEIFKAAVVRVPFVDVLNTMLDASLPLTVGEYEEWGNPNIKSEYEYMKTYSPYDNVAARKYPAMLVRTSLNDSQVMYWEPAKYVARLRAVKTDQNPLLFKIHLGGGGHGGVSGRYDALKDVAFDYAFMLKQVGRGE